MRTATRKFMRTIMRYRRFTVLFWVSNTACLRYVFSFVTGFIIRCKQKQTCAKDFQKGNYFQCMWNTNGYFVSAKIVLFFQSIIDDKKLSKKLLSYSVDLTSNLLNVNILTVKIVSSVCGGFTSIQFVEVERTNSKFGCQGLKF